MILLDADVILIDRKYRADSRYDVNRAAMDRLKADRVPLGLMAHTLLEVIGAMSHGTATKDIPLIPAALQTVYGLAIVPDVVLEPDYARTTYDILVRQMQTKMSLGDAVQAVQIADFKADADLLMTWNARHFVGKIPIPVLTPAEWLAQLTPAGPVP